MNNDEIKSKIKSFFKQKYPNLRIDDESSNLFCFTLENQFFIRLRVEGYVRKKIVIFNMNIPQEKGRGSGFGTNFINELKDVSKSLNLNKILAVNAYNYDFWQKRGFKKKKISFNFPDVFVFSLK